jgi:hypothetical protein
MYSTALARQLVTDVSQHLDDQQGRRSRIARLRGHRT